jgi:antitoxin component of MazEF toxin-antitoxin module
MSKKYTLNLEEDDSGDLFVKLPDDLIEELGWLEGDVISYSLDGDTIILTKVEE